MLKLNAAIIFLLLPAAGPAAAAEQDGKVKIEALVPAYLPVGHPAQAELTAGLRAKLKTLGLNGLAGVKGDKISKAVLLLPKDLAGAGVLSFELEGGKMAGLYQCEALGRGLTSEKPAPGWRSGLIGGVTIYYAPAETADGATVPGVYDLRNITPELYEIVLLGKAADLTGEEAIVARTKDKKGGGRPYFSAVWKHWYPKNSPAVPVDMVWAEDSQAGSQGEGVPVFDPMRRASTPEEGSRRAKQLAHAPRYYTGPYGRSGFAVHTDRWEDADKAADPRFAGRPELSDFRYRDTAGCVKLRPGCLELLNEFISGQENLKRRVQLEVFETPLLDKLPAEGPAVKQGQ